MTDGAMGGYIPCDREVETYYADEGYYILYEAKYPIRVNIKPIFPHLQESNLNDN